MNKDLTIGKPETVLGKFVLPMFISVIFQQMYNIADSIIAGKFAGEMALAAVGASYPITMIFMAIALGCNIGCTVVISRYFGAKEFGKMKSAITTTLLVALGLSFVITLFGMGTSTLLMQLINTPLDIFTEGRLYLQIYIAGFTFLFLYNVATGIFTSLGDSKTPLYLLITSSLGNIVLDYVLVAYYHLGVAGVAWATFIAQGVACILALVSLYFRFRKLESESYSLFSWKILQHIIQIAFPSILQQSFISLGNIAIQWLINGYGSSIIAGYSAAVKLNTFTITSFSTLGNGISSFTAQNLGAGRLERIKEGLRAGLRISFGIAFVFMFGYFCFPDFFISLFLKEHSSFALQTGTNFLRIVSPFYAVVCIKLACDGVLRGSGMMKEFMTATFADLILRCVLAFLLSSLWGAQSIWWSWPLGWIAGTILSVYYLKRDEYEKGE